MPNQKNEAETNNLLTALLETSPASITIHDFEGNFLYVNQKTLDLYGYSREELQNLNLLGLEMPGDVAGIKAHLDKLKQDGETSFETQHRRKDGSKIILLINAKVGKLDGKQVVLSIATDITQQKLVEQEKNALILEKTAERDRVEAALRVSEEKYHFLLRNIPDVIWTSDEYGNTSLIREGVTKVFGFTPNEIIADSNLWFGRIHKNDLPRVKKAYQDLFDQNNLFDIEYRIQRKDGTWIWVHDRASKTYIRGGIRHADGMFRDVTFRKLAEDELRRHRDHLEELVKERTNELESKNAKLAQEIAERKRVENALLTSEKSSRTLSMELETILDHIPAIIFSKDLNNRYLHVNKFLADAQHTSKENLIGKSMFDLFPKDEAQAYWDADLQVASSRKPLLNIEEPWTTPEGRKWVSTSKIPMFDETGNVYAILGMGVEITERKRAEEALRESETKYRTVFDSVPIGIGVADMAGHVLECNPAMSVIMGYSEAELKALNVRDIYVDPGERETFLRTLSETGLVHDLEFKLRRKNGEEFRALLNASLSNVGDREVILTNVWDLTERKQAEEALRMSEARLKDAQALGRIGNWEFDVATQKITWSDQTYHLYDRDPVLGPPTPEEEAGYYTADQVKRIREYARLAIEEGKTIKYDLEAHLPSGKSVIFFVTMQPIKDTQGRVIKLFGTVQDITESRRAEERLKQTNQFLDLIIDNIPLIITVKDARTLTYQRVNRTFAQESKMDPVEIVGKTADALFSPAEAKGITINDRKVIESKKSSVFDGRETRTGRIFRTKKIPLLNSAGEVIYLLSIADDVTEQIKIEQERKVLLENALQLSDMKSDLLSQAAHELKTPLTIIMGWAELLFNAKKQGKNLDATFDLEDIETILRNAERLNNIINDFLDMSRIDKGKFTISKQSLDFTDVIENATIAVNYLAVQKNITVSKEIIPTDPVPVDRRRMEQVIINLLSNAIKYSPERTRVTIKTSPVKIGAHKMFRIQLIDEGFGFTPEELAEAMTPFAKTSTQQEQKKGVPGTGLGLFISRRIVEQHGGTLVLRSDGANKGTQAEILLPMD